MNYGTLVSGDPAMVALWLDVCREMNAAQEAWIAELRAQGVKAAHPDDGWVDRKNNTLQFVYPQFNDGAEAGDLVALGWPPKSRSSRTHRIVRLKELKRTTFSEYWAFEPVEAS